MMITSMMEMTMMLMIVSTMVESAVKATPPALSGATQREQIP